LRTDGCRFIVDEKQAAAPATDNRLSLLTIASARITATARFTYLTRKQRNYFGYESANKYIIRLIIRTVHDSISHKPKAKDANIIPN